MNEVRQVSSSASGTKQTSTLLILCGDMIAEKSHLQASGPAKSIYGTLYVDTAGRKLLSQFVRPNVCATVLLSKLRCSLFKPKINTKTLSSKTNTHKSKTKKHNSITDWLKTSLVT